LKFDAAFVAISFIFFANWCGAIVIVIAWSWIYNFLCNQCLSHLTLWVRMLLMRDVLDTTLSDNDCQWIAPGQNLTILSETTNLMFKTTVWYRKQLPFYFRSNKTKGLHRIANIGQGHL
jgi:uncharacterized protein with PIN domain